MNTPPKTKHERMEALISQNFAEAGERNACIHGYIQCFNRGEYYEAHDVLEHLWLQLPRTAPEYGLYKGLIQLAGGFVHLRLHSLAPDHRIHGRRLAPARKLFALAAANLAPHARRQCGFAVPELLALIQRYTPRQEQPGANPWSPEYLPRFPV